MNRLPWTARPKERPSLCGRLGNRDRRNQRKSSCSPAAPRRARGYCRECRSCTSKCGACGPPYAPLFDYTEEFAYLRGIQIQTHHISHLFQKLRIVRELERFRGLALLNPTDREPGASAFHQMLEAVVGLKFANSPRVLLALDPGAFWRLGRLGPIYENSQGGSAGTQINPAVPVGSFPHVSRSPGKEVLLHDF